MILDSVDFENEDIIITAPESIVYFNDWQKYLEGRSNNRHDITNDLKKFGFKKVIGYRTKYSNFYCELVEMDVNGKLYKVSLGDFYTNFGFVAVFSLDEILKYKPHYDCYEEVDDDCAVLIENFTGSVSIERVGNKAIIIVGQGSTDFYSEVME